MIEIKNLSRKFRNNIILDNVSFKIKYRQSISIVGESGSGKSTIANILLGFYKENTAEIYYQGRSLNEFNSNDWKNYRKNIQPVFQDAKNSLDPRMKVKDIIAEPLCNFTRLSKEDRYSKVNEILELVDLKSEDGEKYPYAFSTGQQKRINLARAIICNPKIVILDELTSGLDPEIKNNIMDLIKRLQEDYNITFIVITHDISVAMSLTSHIIILKEGMVVEDVIHSNDISNLKTSYAHELIEAVPKLKYIELIKMSV
ncbi:ABC transporter ATP-binding protein [Vallitalea longa]|uniref:ABC transporter ATP-binding protein n=1 Tax=Vallitalea longa TaxID=2936439 RepID=A0A9W5Y810_9FIRM|nr:dipeptide/oligopeptide/nickel ABC transporter ATP-binding protein [Vallitalea longa]GKX27590.1 ABC transporter ATP-binding protein [Vallitalea longa]